MRVVNATVGTEIRLKGGQEVRIDAGGVTYTIIGFSDGTIRILPSCETGRTALSYDIHPKAEHGINIGYAH
jgi:hypothetical protein